MCFYPEGANVLPQQHQHMFTTFLLERSPKNENAVVIIIE